MKSTTKKPILTQGQRKTIQKLRELFENEVFIKELTSILSKPKKSKLLFSFAQKYGLELEFGSPFLDYLTENKLPNENTPDPYFLDICKIIDEAEELLNPEDGHPIYKPLPDKKLQLELYPIHIAISPRATKRDVLDFINKKWDYIRYSLDMYGEIEIIRRKPKAKRDRFIWKHRNLPAKEIAEKVNKKFKNENLTYADVNSILYHLRKRKFSKLV